MSLYDLQQRTDLILKKYAQYDKPMDKRRVTKGEDPFNDEYDLLDARADELLQQAEENSKEGNRAVVATRNAEIRKSKQWLLSEGIAGLQKKVKKGRGVTKVLIDERQRRITALIDKIYSIPDGMGGARRPIHAKLGLGGKGGESISLSLQGSSGIQATPAYYQSTAETSQFEKEWQASKRKQDAQLDRVERGVGNLAEMARGMQEELDKQVPILDDVDKQLNSVTSKLKNNNARLKGLLISMRSKRNFCVDMVLLSLLLGIVVYIISLAQKKKS